MVQFLVWQKAYDQHRRRQKSKSAGVSLVIRKGLLDEYAQDDYQLCFEVRMKRSSDRYVPDEEMNWSVFRRAFSYLYTAGLMMVNCLSAFNSAPPKTNPHDLLFGENR